MKIESNGFRITDICPQVLAIEVDGAGDARLVAQPVLENYVSVATPYMSREEFSAFRDAVNVAWERMAGEEPRVERHYGPVKILD